MACRRQNSSRWRKCTFSRIPLCACCIPIRLCLVNQPKAFVDSEVIIYHNQNSSENRLPSTEGINNSSKMQKANPQIFVVQTAFHALDTPRVVINPNYLSRGEFRRYAIRCRHLPLEAKRFSEQRTLVFHPASSINHRTRVSTVRSVLTASTIVSSSTFHLVHKSPTHFRQPEYSP